MNKKAFTLVEIAVVCLITSILFNGMFTLLQLSLSRFSQQESHILMTWEAGMLCSYLHQDFEDAFFRGDPQAGLDRIKFSEDGFCLPRGSNEVTYTFTRSTGKIHRILGNKTTEIGKGMVKDFNVSLEIQLPNGEIIPGDQTEKIGDSSIVPQRIWFKVHLMLKPESEKQPVISQEFNFYASPVRLNRQLQSIWKP